MARPEASPLHDTRALLFISREQIFTKSTSHEAFKAFCERNKTAFYKPCGNCCGEGIERIDLETTESETLFSRMVQEDAVLDTAIVQHRKMTELYLQSVNALRFFTFRNNGKIFFTGCALRIGTTSFIDNYSAGGLVCSVDLETGITKEKAENYLGMRFSNHPVTGVALEGFEIPKWHEVLGFVFDMAKVYELNYVAWDIAVEENRISMVEANAAGMINTIQVAGGSPKKALIHKLEKELEHKSKGSTQDSYQMILCHGDGFD